MVVLSVPYNVLLQRFHDYDSKDLGMNDLSMTNGRITQVQQGPAGQRKRGNGSKNSPAY